MSEMPGIRDSQAGNEPLPSPCYTDDKGRLRWHCNDVLAEQLKQLYDFLVIGNYDESHARRYPRLAHLISRYPESMETLREQDRLSEIPGVSGTISQILCELMLTGTCQKMEQGDDTFRPPPKSVLEMTKIRGLGAKTAKTLYQEHGIDSLNALVAAAESGVLERISGIGKRMIGKVLQAGGRQP